MCREESRLLQGLTVFKNVEKGLLLKTTALLVFFLWLVKSLKNLNNRTVDHLEKCGLFLISSMVLRFLDQLTANLQTVVSDRISRAFNRSRATRAVAVDISKVWTEFGKLTSS